MTYDIQDKKYDNGRFISKSLSEHLLKSISQQGIVITRNLQNLHKGNVNT